MRALFVLLALLPLTEAPRAHAQPVLSMSLRRVSPSACSAGEGDVLQTGPPGQDTFVGDVYHQNGAPAAEDLSFGGWGDHYYVYLQFPTPLTTGFRGATLCLFATTTALNDAGLLLAAVNEPWNQRTLTLSSLPSHDLVGSFGPVADGWNALDITRLAKAWAAGEIPNHGIALVPQRNNETNGAFASAEASDAAIRPRIVIGPMPPAAGDARLAQDPDSVTTRATDAALARVGPIYRRKRDEWIRAQNSNGLVARVPAHVAMRLLNETFASLRVSIRSHRPSFTEADWEPSVRLVRILVNDVFLFENSSLGTDSLSILTVLESGELVAVEAESRRAVLSNPLGYGPSSNGTWLRVRTVNDEHAGWLFAEPSGEPPLAEPYRRVNAPAQIADQSTSDSPQAPIILILVVLVVVSWLLLGQNAASSAGAVAWNSAREGGGGGDDAEPLNPLFTAGRSRPQRHWWESEPAYRQRIAHEGHERTVEGFTGEQPVRRLFELDEDYRTRVAAEADERIIEAGAGEAPSRRLFEDESEYRKRIRMEASEQIIEQATEKSPTRRLLEGDTEFGTRVVHEANESIIERATGRAPHKGWFENDENYRQRVADEANEIRASQN